MRWFEESICATVGAHSWAPQIDVEILDVKEGFHLLSKRLQRFSKMVQKGVVCNI